MLAAPRKKSKSRSRSYSLGKEKLEVQVVGSYNVSIAKSIADLRRIDASVFSLAKNVDALLSKHYGDGFGFIVAAFRNSQEKHPLAYVHPLGVDKKLFVPTRHYHHGEGEEEIAHWDHEV